jgi:nucleoside transporter
MEGFLPASDVSPLNTQSLPLSKNDSLFPLQNAQQSPTSPRYLQLRLSTLMFLQYSVPGAMLPILSLWLQENLHFSAEAIGAICATQAVAALFTPLAAGQFADRWFPAQHCIAGFSCLAGIVLWVLPGITGPRSVFVAALAAWLLITPSMSLTVTLSLSHLPSPFRQFGPVRMWGTIGWVAPLLFLGYWLTSPSWIIDLVDRLGFDRIQNNLGDAFRLSGLLSFLLAGYALTLPHTPPRRDAIERVAPLAAIRALRGRAFMIYCLCSMGFSLTLAFSTQINPLLLHHLGVPEDWISPALTISQSMEIVSLGLLPYFLPRLGTRHTMLLGLTAWMIAFTVLSWGRPTWLVIGSFSLYGICICCFYVAGQIYVNSRVQGEARASAQTLLLFVNGLGLLIGNLLAGKVHAWSGGDFPVTYFVAAGIAMIQAVVFFVGFPEEDVSLSRGACSVPSQLRS